MRLVGSIAEQRPLFLMILFIISEAEGLRRLTILSGLIGMKSRMVFSFSPSDFGTCSGLI